MAKIMSVITVLILIFTLASSCYAQEGNLSDKNEFPLTDLYGLSDPPKDGLYKVKDVTIKFIPPAGWLYAGTMMGNIKFMPRGDSLITSLNIFCFFKVVSNDAEWQENINNTREIMGRSPVYLNTEIINFANTKALSSVVDTDGLKARQIEFFKNGIGFMLNFTAEEQDFDKFLPVVEESFKSFEIISPAPEQSGS